VVLFLFASSLAMWVFCSLNGTTARTKGRRARMRQEARVEQQPPRLLLCPLGRGGRQDQGKRHDLLVGQGARHLMALAPEGMSRLPLEGLNGSRDRTNLADEPRQKRCHNQQDKDT
jgi:hypothetical protein